MLQNYKQITYHNIFLSQLHLLSNAINNFINLRKITLAIISNCYSTSSMFPQVFGTQFLYVAANCFFLTLMQEMFISHFPVLHKVCKFPPRPHGHHHRQPFDLCVQKVVQKIIPFNWILNGPSFTRRVFARARRKSIAST